MNGIGLTVLLVAVTTVSFTAGSVFRDARARGLPLRKVLTWAALSSQEWTTVPAPLSPGSAAPSPPRQRRRRGDMR